INKTSFVSIIAACMTVTPAAVSQLVATYMGICFALACVFATLFVYFCFESDDIFSYFLCICFIVCSLALYQSYIAHAAVLTLMTIALYLYQNEEQQLIIKKTVKAIITALAGMIAYFISNKIILAVLHLESSSRLAEFSFGRIFSNIGYTIVWLYKSYFDFLNDSVLLRKYLYLLLFTVITSFVIKYLIGKENTVIYKIMFIVCLFLVPFASNIIGLITPDNPITILMAYQYILIVPFCFALLKDNSIRIAKCMIVSITVLLCWTHIISANATFECYKMSHDYVYNQYSQVIYDVQHTDGYVKDETPVFIAGFFEDSTLRKNIKTYNYSFELFDDLVFWNTLGGATYNRHRYVMQYFGLDFIDFSIDEYQRIIKTDEFKKMNLWPDTDGIKFIDGYLVVKINNNYIE
ncbi:MAG: glucosyltransferase domain-containing protein, partial [Erysipelotrichaceae bacterium]|nr:glucosyltransferase domain-containing protein [Erysipelotrichaceae bacterium]